MLELGKESTVNALGQTWTLGRMEIGILEDFITWIRQQASDPFAGLEKIVPLLNREDALAEIKEAKAKRDALEKLDYASPVVQEWASTSRGGLYIFFLLLKQRQPSVSYDTAFAIAQELGADRMAELMTSSRGKIPEGNGRPPATPGAKQTGRRSSAS